MTGEGYTPIACALHDELQLLVLRGRVVRLVALDEGGAPVAREAKPTDVATRGGAEWLVLDDGSALRLDRLVEVDGRPFKGSS